ncbi:hypothetical protein BJX99DRAFT_258751 [Aspergillus californicus]
MCKYLYTLFTSCGHGAGFDVQYCYLVYTCQCLKVPIPPNHRIERKSKYTVQPTPEGLHCIECKVIKARGGQPEPSVGSHAVDPALDLDAEYDIDLAEYDLDLETGAVDVGNGGLEQFQPPDGLDASTWKGIVPAESDYELAQFQLQSQLYKPAHAQEQAQLEPGFEPLPDLGLAPDACAEEIAFSEFLKNLNMDIEAERATIGDLAVPDAPPVTNPGIESQFASQLQAQPQVQTQSFVSQAEYQGQPQGQPQAQTQSFAPQVQVYSQGQDPAVPSWYPSMHPVTGTPQQPPYDYHVDTWVPDQKLARSATSPASFAENPAYPPTAGRPPWPPYGYQFNAGGPDPSQPRLRPAPYPPRRHLTNLGVVQIAGAD